jgi:uncharacterized damage-inducible protein DinB
MKAIDKQKFLNDLYQRTEAILELAVREYQNLDETALNFSENVDSWSIAQVLSHLNSYGNYYLPRLQNLRSQTSNFKDDTYTAGWLGAYFVRMMDINRNNKRYKAAAQHLPKVTEVYAEVATFIAQQEQFLQCLKSFEQVNLSQLRVPISINKFIKLRLGDILAFLVMHNERHVAQIGKIKAAQKNALAQRTILAPLAP